MTKGWILCAILAVVLWLAAMLLDSFVLLCLAFTPALAAAMFVRGK